MKLKPSFIEEYIRRLDEIWPEFSAELKTGSIFD